jgi:ribosome-associated protein
MAKNTKVNTMTDLQHEDEAPEYQRPNKSQLKREAMALQDLVKSLLELPEPEWKSLSFPEHILDALKALKMIEQHGAKKRQLKRVAKLLREEDTSAAKDAIEHLKKQQAGVHATFHKVEQWRDRLIAGSKEDVASFLRAYPLANAQTLNQLVRHAKQERAQHKSTKYSKLLFKWLREIVG